MQRARVILRQGEIDTLVSSEPLTSAFRTYNNLCKSIVNRADLSAGVRFEQTSNSFTAIWPPSARLPDGWSENVTFYEEDE